ncbi:hypothetical protein COU49_02590 [Candidatus Nomurabacteria bacterium CG10_big_fil_rev_8_21_14_0_10_35_16]|uniref:Phage shock protein PspC N-terminal domain-containing protein n=1 Tax=Candidatus Nomurabacteria bacterium CG10_big_fil_rev_8_21_14_0_10_35_16 TaxID=1974731 RepID=A0A2H0TB10_9BACT|nr:MAG: hypothetical protein COU49_02590 [Candidatus Nomurabacteria bacterium CG10_big_fil_rev_8_21_14_0_10_35_16]
MGEYFNVDPLIFRLIFIVFTLGAGSGVIIYLILAFLIPKEPLPGVTDTGSQIFDVKARIEMLVSELHELRGLSKRRKIFGLIIVCLGVFLLLNQLLPWRIFDWGVLWAVLIIYLGILVLRGKGYGTKQQFENNSDSKTNEIPKINPEMNQKVYSKKNGGGVFRLFFGLIFLIIGFSFLIQNFNLIPGLNFDFSVLLSFWPVLIILSGLSILSRGTWLGSLFSIIITFAIVSIMVFYFILPAPVNLLQTFSFNIPKSLDAEHTDILIELGASSVEIESGSESLIAGELNSNVATLSTENIIKDGVQLVTIKMQESFKRMKEGLADNLNFILAEDVPLSIQMKSGASNINFDASNIILENFELDTSASKVVLKFGEKAKNTNVLLKAGVSSVDITIPKNVGARIQMSGALNQNHFPEFNKIDDNQYQTDNYNTSVNKIDIFIESEVSSVSINRI